MKKLKLRPCIKETMYIIAIVTLILCSIKIGCMRMDQQKNDQIPARKVVLVNKN